MQTKLYVNAEVAKEAARTLKMSNPDFSYRVGLAALKPSPYQGACVGEQLAGYFCIRIYRGKDFHSFA
jgi:hypothetical protein